MAMAGVKVREGQDNWFTPLRLLFALMVVFGHGWMIALRDIEAEPTVFHAFKLSFIAVNMFFIVSGFLVTKSMLYRRNLVDFGVARALRIWPALALLVVLVTFGLGPFVSALSPAAYYAESSIWWQPLQVLGFGNTHMKLPQAFLSNDETLAGAPLWTLRYEVLAYIGTALAFAVGALRGRWMITAQFAGACALMFGLSVTGLRDALPDVVDLLVRFSVPYLLGATVLAWADRMVFRLWHVPVLFGLAWLMPQAGLIEIGLNIALASLAFTLAFLPVRAGHFVLRMPDLSYGIYIWHWVVMQTVFYVMPQMGPVTLIAVGTAISTAIAWFSWTYVERPVLGWKSRLSAWLRPRRSL